MKELSKMVLVGLVLLMSMSCRSNISQIGSANTPKDSQAVAQSAVDIKGLWEEECKKLDPIKRTKNYPGRKLDVLVKLLKEAPSAQFDAELERVRTEPNDYYHLPEYDQILLQALFSIYASRRDRHMLVYLLSAKCPRFIATSPVELEVASIEVKEPFLILFESYDTATEGEQRFLVDVLRNSLKDLSQMYPNDAEFVEKDRAWYTENASILAINPYYHPAGRAEQRDLFVQSK